MTCCGKPLTTKNYVDYRCECGATYRWRGIELVRVGTLPPEPQPEKAEGCPCGAELVSTDRLNYTCSACGTRYQRRGIELVPTIERCIACRSEVGTTDGLAFTCSNAGSGALYWWRDGKLVPATSEHESVGCGRCLHMLESNDGLTFTCSRCRTVFWRRGGEYVLRGENETVPGEDPVPRAYVVDRDRDPE